MDLAGVLGPHPLVAILAAVEGASLAASAFGAALRRRGIRSAGLVLFAAAFLLNTAILGGRWIEAGRPPFKTLFETLLLYPWCVGAVTLGLVGLYRVHAMVPFAAAVILAGLGYALYRPDVEIVNLPPALQSAWFVPHVVTYFIAYAALFASFALALVAIRKSRVQSPESKVGMTVHGRADHGPTTDDRGPRTEDPGPAAYAHGAAVFGTCALTLGLAMGAAWGKFAWGDYWSWDPKENWALVTWLVYMAYLHVRRVPGWQGRRAMGVLVVAFGAVVFTYLGMNLLPTAEDSLHVYQ